MNRPYEIVDLDSPQIKIEESVSRFKKRSTVFLSFSRRQFSLVEEVDRQLKLYDFNTFSAFDFLGAGDFSSLLADKLGDNIKNAAENGYVLSFVNEISPFQMEETEYAIKCSKEHIIPIATTPHFFDNLSPRTKEIFAGLNWIDVSEKQETEAAEYIVQRLLEIDMKQYLSG